MGRSLMATMTLAVFTLYIVEWQFDKAQMFLEIKSFLEKVCFLSMMPYIAGLQTPAPLKRYYAEKRQNEDLCQNRKIISFL